MLVYSFPSLSFQGHTWGFLLNYKERELLFESQGCSTCLHRRAHTRFLPRSILQDYLSHYFRRAEPHTEGFGLEAMLTVIAVSHASDRHAHA